MNGKWMWARRALTVVVMAGGAAAALGAASAREPLPSVVVYKSRLCGCCTKWVDHMRAAGFRVVVRDVDDLLGIEARYGVPKGLTSCHTALAGGYLVIGHVPADLVQRLLQERPAVAGITVPGMPADAPGMDAGTGGPYDVLVFDRDGTSRVYARR